MRLSERTAFWLREAIILALCAWGGLALAPAVRAHYADDPGELGAYLYAGILAWSVVEALFSLKRTVQRSRQRQDGT